MQDKLRVSFLLTQDAKDITESQIVRDENGIVTSVGVDFIPTKGTAFSAGYDLKACIPDTIVILPTEVVRIPTGICLNLFDSIQHGVDYNLPTGFIYPRSGLGTRGLVLANTVGVIDPDYRGELIVMAFNRSEDVITVKTGDRIAQLVIGMSINSEFFQVEAFPFTTERDANGFGSTGE